MKNNKKIITKTNKTNYPTGDFLIRFKNAARAGQKTVMVAKTNMIVGLAEALKRMGYVEKITDEDGVVTVHLTVKHKKPVLAEMLLVSKPGLRVYRGSEELRAYRGPSIFLISTSVGILSSREAIKKGVGGEIIAEVI